jgi:hypothetical protein
VAHAVNPDSLPWQPSCDCDRAQICAPPKTSPRDFEIVVGNVPGRAQTWPDSTSKKIEVDGAWWGRLNRPQRAAALAHEMAHHDDSRWCERCADARAGARMRYAGKGADETASALGSIVVGRRSYGPALWGWARADRRLSLDRPRGLDLGPDASGGSFVVVVVAAIAAAVILTKGIK